MLPGHGYYFPNLEMREQTELKQEIDEALKKDLHIPSWKELYLDAVNYFSVGRYNESVIIMNTTLESFVSEYLFQRLQERPQLIRKKEDPKDEVLSMFKKGFHKVMGKFFEEVVGRSFRNQQGLWKKFDDARIMRSYAIHSFTRKIPENEAKATLDDIMEIINWIEMK